MNRTKRIEFILKKNFLNFNINIVDNSHLHIGHNDFNGKGETHITAQLKIHNKSKINRLEVHNKVNSLLKEEFNNGLHSLEIKIILID